MQGFCKTLWRKLRLRGSLLLVLIHFWGVGGRGNGVGWEWASIWVWLGGRWIGVGRLFEAGRLLTFFVFRMGAYSRWALIGGLALIPINTVRVFLVFHPSPRKAIPSLHRTLATGQIFQKDQKYLMWPLYSWNYISAKSVTYAQHINSHLTLNIHQNLILNPVLLILIFRSFEIYYCTQWKEIFEIFLFKVGFKKSYFSFTYRFNLLFNCNILRMFYYQ